MDTLIEKGEIRYIYKINRAKMNVIGIKEELIKLIEEENDPGVLKAISTLLKKTSLDPVLKSKLSSRALKSNEDIDAGRLLSREDMERETDELL